MFETMFDWLFGEVVDIEGFEKRVQLASEFPHFSPDGVTMELMYQDILLKTGC